MNRFSTKCQRGLTPFLALAMGLTGCAWSWKTAKERELEAQAANLKSQLIQMEGRLTEAEKARKDLLAQADGFKRELARLQDERALEVKRLAEEKERAAQAAAKAAAQEKAKEAQELLEAQRRLAEGLKSELKDARAKLAMTERGLVLTFLDEIFFDSGKAVIKPEGVATLEKVASVLKETVPDSPVAVEGHTDNEPIKYSGWKSNWELSAARSLAVVHYFIGQQGVAPQRLQAIGFGEHHPVTSNETAEGRRQNRRVEVVILPSQLKKARSTEAVAAATTPSP